MFKQSIFAFVLLVVASSLIHADNKAITGVVAKVDRRMIEVKSDKTTCIVPLDSRTTYRKWIVGKLTRQERDSRFEDLKIGSRVRIDLTEDEPVTAKTVWLVQSFFREAEYAHTQNSAR
jgi:hypothetical protein